jgi:phosphoglycolate phosphatase
MHTSIQVILFDIDGTLIHPRGVGRAATYAAMQEVFGTVEGVEQHIFGGKTDWLTLSELLAHRGYSPDDIGLHIPIYAEAISRHMARLIPEFPVEACPGALEVVRELHQRNQHLLGIITGNVAPSAPVKLRAGGFDPGWFPVGAFGNESIQRNRLSALAIERAERHLKRQISARQVMIVGDTVADIECAQAVGAVAVAVRTGFATEEELIAAKPDYLLNDLTEFMHLLNPSL